ncbi:hypothetical protein GCM10010508_49450 [Streptomyces naganishii JCM 4654]|uniref:F5/8 type C domain-containing protein n=2 Tax=Streptomyces naganishii TaxID=285447 RepID=A0A918Y7W0_9ACTN|nr:hypothetical protein GCM10010508_49450 [Streptomyces naganishii JCM 4654]
MADQASPAYRPSRRFAVATDSALLAAFAFGAGESDGHRPRSFCLDLRAPCRVDWIRLVFGADGSVPVLASAGGTGEREANRGAEQVSYAAEFVVETSLDLSGWRSVYRTAAGTGGVVDIQLPGPVPARWVRMTARRLSSPHPLGLNAFEVFGTRSGAPGGNGRAPGPDRAPGPGRAAGPGRADAADGSEAVTDIGSAVEAWLAAVGVGGDRR